jgi:hypothetical protein
MKLYITKTDTLWGECIGSEVIKFWRGETHRLACGRNRLLKSHKGFNNSLRREVSVPSPMLVRGFIQATLFLYLRIV